MEIFDKKINESVDLIKKSMSTFTLMENPKLNLGLGHEIISPPLSPNICDYIIDNCTYVDKSIKSIATDIILNDWIFEARSNSTEISPTDESIKLDKTFTENDNFLYKDEKLCKQVWSLSKQNFFNAVKDHLTYGAGALLITLFNPDDPDSLILSQIPTSQLIIEEFKMVSGSIIPYALKMSGAATKRYRLLGYGDDLADIDPDWFTIKAEEYITDENGININGIVLWIGSDSKSNYFTTPDYKSALTDILSLIVAQNLDYTTLQAGNMLQGILSLVTAPEVLKEGDIPIKEKLADEIKKQGKGVMFLHIEDSSIDKTQKTRIQFQDLHRDNYDYLKTLKSGYVSEILTATGVPKPRLNILDDTKTTSDDSKLTFDIYLKNLEAQKAFYMEFIDLFNLLLFNIPSGFIKITEPVFSDNSVKVISNTINLYNSGLIDYKDASKILEKIYPTLDFNIDSGEFSADRSLENQKEIALFTQQIAPKPDIKSGNVNNSSNFRGNATNDGANSAILSKPTNTNAGQRNNPNIQTRSEMQKDAKQAKKEGRR